MAVNEYMGLSIKERKEMLQREFQQNMEFENYRKQKIHEEETMDRKDKSLRNSDGLLIETNSTELKNVLDKEEAACKDRLRREDSEKVTEEIVGMKVMEVIKNKKAGLNNSPSNSLEESSNNSVASKGLNPELVRSVVLVTSESNPDSSSNIKSKITNDAVAKNNVVGNSDEDHNNMNNNVVQNDDETKENDEPIHVEQSSDDIDKTEQSIKDDKNYSEVAFADDDNLPQNEAEKESQIANENTDYDGHELPNEVVQNEPSENESSNRADFV